MFLYFSTFCNAKYIWKQLYSVDSFSMWLNKEKPYITCTARLLFCTVHVSDMLFHQYAWLPQKICGSGFEAYDLNFNVPLTDFDFNPT